MQVVLRHFTLLITIIQLYIEFVRSLHSSDDELIVVIDQ